MSERERLARELYRRIYPGQVNTPDWKRTRESDAAEFDRAYKTWDAGREGWAPGGRCRDIADSLIAAGFGAVDDGYAEPEPEENFWDDRTTPLAYSRQDSERDMAARRAAQNP